MSARDPLNPKDLEARLARELQWHEEHPESGELETVSRYKRLVLERMRARQWKLLGDLAGKSVLEIGCGVGRETVELARRGGQVLAIDLSPTLVEVARQRVAGAGLEARVRFAAMPAERLSEDGQHFDVVVGNGVLHHLDLPRFKECLPGLLTPGAVAQFTEPIAHNPLLRLYRLLTPHLHSPEEAALTASAIAEFVKGFSTVQLQYHNLSGLLCLPVPYVLGMSVGGKTLDATLAADALLTRNLPFLRRYSQYVIIQVGAP
jgi:2-polyprenyl-3-methyl-5-hydroxy-6-metoxy-1,4-benzoquinol methylase